MKQLAKNFLHLNWLGDNQTKHHKWNILAVVCGLLASLCALIFPLLPVKTNLITFGLPDNGSVHNINAPMITLVPQEFSAKIPCDVIRDFTTSPGIVLSTEPGTDSESLSSGFFVNNLSDRIAVVDRGVELISQDKKDLLAPGTNCSISIESNYNHTRVSFDGIQSRPDKPAVNDVHDPVLRPQVVGLYTDATAHKDQLRASVTVDNRWETSPTIIKQADAVIGIIAMLIALFSLLKIDRRDGRRGVRFPIGKLRITGTDVFVTTILGIWVFLGPSTSDDGYLVTMAKLSGSSGYMPNFFRWWGAAENPFGWYYYLLQIMTRINSAAWFMRIPAFLLGLVCWLLLSREILPRLGRTVRKLPVARWSAATAMLVVWLPFNNGLRPEPEVTVSTLLVWCFMERAIAGAQFFPAALAVITAAFTVGEAPGGTMAIGVLVVCSSAFVKSTRHRWKRDGIIPLLAPIMGGGLAYLFVAFADQPLRIVVDGVRAKTVAGPSLHWWNEPIRFFYLNRFPDVDGSFNRRIGVYITLLSLGVICVVLSRRRHLHGIAKGPAWRLVGIMIAIMLAMMLTPTKWTHHFGVYAAFTGALASLAITLVHPIMATTTVKRLYFTAAALFVTALAFGGSNGWWFVSSYKVPWWNSTPSIKGLTFSAIFLLISILTAIYALYRQISAVVFPLRNRLRKPHPITRYALPPFIVLTVFIILLELSAFAVGAYRERDGFSWLKSNISDLSGKSCSLADQVLVEPDVNAAILKPSGNMSPTAALYGIEAQGFSPQALPSSLRPEANPTTMESASAVATDSKPGQTQTDADPKATVNGSVPDTGQEYQRPFGLSPQTPIAATYLSPGFSHLTSAWYTLPPRDASTPLITLSAAGIINATLIDTTVDYGGSITLELAHQDSNGTITPLGKLSPIDVGPTPKWRNLRYPTDAINPQANLVRIVAQVQNAGNNRWIALTPPRMAHMITAQQFLGSQKPGLIDWLPALAFPCQQEMKVHDGLTQIPEFRIEPDYNSVKGTTNLWQNGKFGGPNGITDRMLNAVSIPSYLTHNWALDWGNIQLFTPIRAGVYPTLTRVPQIHSGLWLPSPIRSNLF